MGETGQINDPNAVGLADEGAGHIEGMGAAWRVVVREDDDVGADQVLCILGAPFASTLRVAGRRDAKARQRLDIFFALDDDDELTSRNRLTHPGQSEKHARDAVEIPEPAAMAVRPPLAERLGSKAYDLKQ